jgi:hypothetical protein
MMSNVLLSSEVEQRVAAHEQQQQHRVQCAGYYQANICSKLEQLLKAHRQQL